MLLVPYPRDECVWIGSRSEVDRHDICAVAVEGLQHLAGLHVPQGARRVAGPGQNLIKKRDMFSETF